VPEEEKKKKLANILDHKHKCLKIDIGQKHRLTG
jgi:hypothetical protein